MSGFGFWGGPEGVKIPTPHIKGQQERRYFHSGPGWSHEGPAWRCHLEHPGDPGWVDQEVLEAIHPDPEEAYTPRHRKPTLIGKLGEIARVELARQDEAVERLLSLPDVPENEDGSITFPIIHASETLEELEGAMALQVAGILQRAPKVAPRSELLWVGVDLDGTIAEPLWTPENPTSEIGEPIDRNVMKLRDVVVMGYKVVIHTSRPWTDYEAIETWLDFHAIPWHQIQCGKPLFALYVDDRGRHADSESWLP